MTNDNRKNEKKEVSTLGPLSGPFVNGSLQQSGASLSKESTLSVSTSIEAATGIPSSYDLLDQVFNNLES